ncbi:ATP-binding cassette domain-containing protein, partial [candidate division WOR-3 bacterium]|nr:ATP-binding cassette domain-containing protein [candidate division WOR-3 bacterium]
MDSLIEIKDVTAGYGRKVAIENITLSIKKEEFVGIIGPNGSGKTTLLKVIMGTLKPFKGSVSVLGTSPEKILKKIGFVPQFFNDDPFQPFITLEVVLFGLYPVLGPFKRVRKKETEMCMEALRQVGMEEMAREPFGHLSGGQMRRVMIARAIVSKPEILILDEPTSG